MVLNSLYEACITQNQTKISQKERKLQVNILMNLDAKFFNRILATKFNIS